jgi:hypothetical protein
MARKSFFSKLTDSLLGNEDETPEEIDRKVEAAVREIQKGQGETLDGSAVLLEHWGEAGNLVYVIDLVPIYDAVGGRDGPVGQRMEEICENLFEHHVAEGEGHAVIQGDLFLMQFIEPDDVVGFRKAAMIANDIGTQMMGERFKTIDIPDLVVIADIAKISDERGRFSLEKAKAVVKAGGINFTMEKPKPNDPLWLKERWLKIQAAAEPKDTEWSELRRRKPSDSDWVRHRKDRRKMKVLKPSRSEQRSGTARRAADHATEVDW